MVTWVRTASTYVNDFERIVCKGRPWSGNSRSVSTLLNEKAVVVTCLSLHPSLCFLFRRALTVVTSLSVTATVVDEEARAANMLPGKRNKHQRGNQCRLCRRCRRKCRDGGNMSSTEKRVCSGLARFEVCLCIINIVHFPKCGACPLRLPHVVFVSCVGT